MAIKYQGITGTVYYVEEKIGGGGEGAIYQLLDNDRQVIKVFKEDKRNAEREEKLRHMVQMQLSQEQLEEVTWPQDVVYNQGNFVGYVMPKLSNTASLVSIYNAGSGKEYDLRYRLLAAINLCYAIKTVHDMGQVCGDLNPQNICIDLDVSNPQRAFHITLVDTDSYHFTAEGKTYRCEVGLADYLAPEIQKKVSGELTLKNAPLPTYTKETDLFALAVHIFALLMNGCHPFACAKKTNDTYENTMSQTDIGNIRDSVVAPQPIENIKDGYFPFYQRKEGVTYPIYAPDFESLPGEVQRLFIRAFVDGYQNPVLRPDAREWIDVLMQVKNNITLCSANGGHYYFAHNTTCPICAAEERIRKMFMPKNKELTKKKRFEDPKLKQNESNTTGKESKIKAGYIIFAIVLLAVALHCVLHALKERHYENYGDGRLAQATEEPFTGDPWELDTETVECPKFGGKLQIPQGATVSDEGDGIYISLHESIEGRVYVRADYYGTWQTGQSSYDQKPTKAAVEDYIEDWEDDSDYIVDFCKRKKLGDKWFLVGQYHDDDYTTLEYKTSNGKVLYELSMDTSNNEYKQEYVELLAKIAATIQFNRTDVTGEVLLSDGTNLYDKWHDDFYIYFKKDGEATEHDYDIDSYSYDDFEITASPGTYQVLIAHEKKDEDGNYIIDQSYKSEITIPDTNNGTATVDIVVS